MVQYIVKRDAEYKYNCMTQSENIYFDELLLSEVWLHNHASH